MSPRYRGFPALRPGDRVVVVAPAGPFDRATFEAGIEIVARRYRVHYDPGVLTRHRYLAGSDERRLGELAAALVDTESRGAFCARGGYGVMRRVMADWEPGRAGQPRRARQLPQYIGAGVAR